MALASKTSGHGLEQLSMNPLQDPDVTLYYTNISPGLHNNCATLCSPS